MSSSKTLTPPLGADEEYEEAHPKMERPTGQLFELQELQKLQLKSFSPESERADQVPPPPGPPPGLPPPPIPQGGERGLREFNYNGRDVKPRNSERSSGVLGRRRVSSYSIYSNYSSYLPSDDDDGSRERDAGLGGAAVGGDGRAVPQVEHVERPPERNPDMRAVPQPLRTASSPGRRRGGSRAGNRGGGPVQQPPPTYQDPYSRDAYSRVRFADPERREESRGGPAPRHIEMANITGGHSVSTLWVFACCAFFWYRCLMDEDF